MPLRGRECPALNVHHREVVAHDVQYGAGEATATLVIAPVLAALVAEAVVALVALVLLKEAPLRAAVRLAEGAHPGGRGGRGVGGGHVGCQLGLCAEGGDHGLGIGSATAWRQADVLADGVGGEHVRGVPVAGHHLPTARVDALDAEGGVVDHHARRVGSEVAAVLVKGALAGGHHGHRSRPGSSCRSSRVLQSVVRVGAGAGGQI